MKLLTRYFRIELTSDTHVANALPSSRYARGIISLKGKRIDGVKLVIVTPFFLVLILVLQYDDNSSFECPLSFRQRLSHFVAFYAIIHLDLRRGIINVIRACF